MKWCLSLPLLLLAMGTSLFTAAVCASEVTTPLPEGVSLSGLILDRQLNEISGLAVSRRHDNLLWVHNDSHDAAALYAISDKGRLRATLTAAVPNIDWEDISSFEHEGRAYLLVADTGDNGGVRETLALHLFEEPSELVDQNIKPLRTLRFRWPDGARDCEAMAVDVKAGKVFLVSKKRVPPELFSVDLFPDDDEIQVATLVGHLKGILQPDADALKRSPLFGRVRSQITAADITADGKTLAVMSYSHVYLWQKHSEGWESAIAKVPVRRTLPWMAQAEAMGFSRDGQLLWLSGERLPAPLIRMNKVSDRAWSGSIK